MPSDRLRKVYESDKWRGPTRRAVLERAGYRCEHVFTNVFSETIRCPVVDKRAGGTQSLTIQHTSEFADPYDIDKLAALCRRHHGMEDGGKAARSRREEW
jgi:hypothetical protein